MKTQREQDMEFDWRTMLYDEETVQELANAYRNGRGMGLGDKAIARSATHVLLAIADGQLEIIKHLRAAMLEPRR